MSSGSSLTELLQDALAALGGNERSLSTEETALLTLLHEQCARALATSPRPANEPDAAAREPESRPSIALTSDGKRRRPTAANPGAAACPIHLCSNGQDVSQPCYLQTQLLQAQKLESVGRLAGGLAHDFNNLLTLVRGHAELAEEDLDPQSPIAQHIDIIRQAAEHAGGLTRQLLAFVRQQDIEPRVINLNTLVQGLHGILRRLIGENIELRTRLDSDLTCVRVDPGQFEQILANLAINGRDAMPKGGILTIETGNVTLDGQLPRPLLDIPYGRYVLISVADTGRGMDESVREHVFEPFFTTKAADGGTGLGLATAYGIIKQAGGHILLESEVGSGSRFCIYLPQVSADETEDPDDRRSGPRQRGDETILLVEDEATVLRMAAVGLRNRGYTVLTATDGEKALKLLSEHEGVVDLIVTDVVMPHVGGRELALAARKMRPGVRILFASGYTDEPIAVETAGNRALEFLQKPYTPAALAERVRELLDSRTGTGRVVRAWC
jgi:signal transduction histidine kinase/CheY-like chemotaxis protein